MAGKIIKIMCVHGLGDHRNSTWEDTWTKAIAAAYPVVNGQTLNFEFVTYDDIFETIDISAWDTIKAVTKLAASGVSSIVRRERGVISDISDKIRWTAGYVVAWVEDEAFKRQSRKRILDAVRAYQPDIIVAHSLGSLVTFNAFSHADVADDEQLTTFLGKARYVTLGSQIGNPFVISNLTHGKIERLPVKFWHHLYNRHDAVFTAEIKVWDVDNFAQTDTPFDIDGIADHAAEEYLAHRSAIENVWRPIGEEAAGIARALGPARTAKGRMARPPAARKKRRALLVGINEYPTAKDRLEGCVNDVFTISSVLQECGFEPEEIRTCLDERATTEGILSRLRWLFDDPREGDERVFYYSGHGARIPEYGENYEPDHHIEALVPWDFDWSPERAITDDQIYMLYSQLPYKMSTVMVFDCCHSGGIHRNGASKARGLTPPDDIRHRELKWDTRTQMWVHREFKRTNEKFSAPKNIKVKYFGENGATRRMGRASMLRGTSPAQYSKLKSADKNAIVGPYLPLIIEACGENELSYEYRHGASSHGAFTYSLAQILRKKKNITFERLVEETRDQLRELQYEQSPQILGPTAVMGAKVPWLVAR
jgi:metacaspase-1